MSFGFPGIQFGWGLQLANMSAIYTKLDANSDAILILRLAGPVTGLLSVKIRPLPALCRYGGRIFYVDSGSRRVVTVMLKELFTAEAQRLRLRFAEKTRRFSARDSAPRQ